MDVATQDYNVVSAWSIRSESHLRVRYDMSLIPRTISIENILLPVLSDIRASRASQLANQSMLLIGCQGDWRRCRFSRDSSWERRVAELLSFLGII